MTTKTLNLLLFFSIAIITSCSTEDDCIIGSGSNITQTINVSNFSGIVLYGNDNVTISQGPHNVEVIGKSNIISKIKTNVSNGIWHIELEDGCYRNADLVYNITVPNINNIDLVGSGNIKVYNFINQSDMDITLTGSGNIDLYDNSGTQNLSVQMDGSGHIFCYGNYADLENFELDIYGSGDFNGFSVETLSSTINIQGSGNCSLYTHNNMDVTIVGSGNVSYKGNPSINSTITGSGQIINSN